MFKPNKERKEAQQTTEKKRWEQSISHEESPRFSTKKTDQKMPPYGKK